jgi:hypothetical protein
MPDRRLHPHAALDQQRIAQLATQSRQRMTDGRLRPSQPLGRPGDVTFGHQDFKHHHEVEVETT